MEIVKKIQRIWPLFPATIYLLVFLIIVSTYLLVMSFSIKGGSFPSFEPLQTVIGMSEFRDALLNTFFIGSRRKDSNIDFIPQTEINISASSKCFSCNFSLFKYSGYYIYAVSPEAYAFRFNNGLSKVG